MALLLLIFLMAPPPVAPAPTEPSVVVETADLSEAQRLFLEGQTRYESADYEGAIQKFTQALDAAKDAGSKDFHVRGLLLYNIGRAHAKAFEVSQDLTHLRQARTIYQQFIREADVEAMMEQFNSQDVEDAKQELKLLETRLQALENPKHSVPLIPPTAPASDAWKRPRNLGIGLVTSGGAVMVTGVALLAAGSTFESSAQDQVNTLADAGVPLDHPAWAEGETFVAGERARGQVFMALGGSLAAVGALGIGVGVASLVKAKRLKTGRVSPSVAMSPSYVGIVLSGRF